MLGKQKGSVLVRVANAMKRLHEEGKAYRGKHLILVA